MRIKYCLLCSSKMVKFTCIILLLIVNTVSSVRNSRNYEYSVQKVSDDLPVPADIWIYFRTLEKVINFLSIHRYYVDLNVALGVFFVNANIRSSLKLKSGVELPSKIRIALENFAERSDDILAYFGNMVEKNLQAKEERRIPVLSLLTRDTSWSHLETFNFGLLKKTDFSTQRAFHKTLEWPKYLLKLYDGFHRRFPDPAESDNCLISLARNPVLRRSKQRTTCKINYSCISMINNGSNIGYSISHRLLFLLMARYSRGCAVVSAAKDKQLTSELCAMMYQEAQLISNHEFLLSDIFMEHIALCSLAGHGQFVRRSWMDEIISFQASPGCFNVTRPLDVYPNTKINETIDWQFFISNETIMGGWCNGHATAVASGALSAAIRYIIQFYY